MGLPSCLEDVVSNMRTCMQTETQTVLQHGESVWEWYKVLMYEGGRGMRLPKWFSNISVDDCCDRSTMKTYLVYHDCGKPYCVANEERKFPDHAERSYIIWKAIGGDDVVALLMRHDMCAHTKDHERFGQLPRRLQISLLCAAISELHSNAAMFGGIESTSFKIKWKNLQRFGNRYFRK